MLVAAPMSYGWRAQENTSTTRLEAFADVCLWDQHPRSRADGSDRDLDTQSSNENPEAEIDPSPPQRSSASLKAQGFPALASRSRGQQGRKTLGIMG